MISGAELCCFILRCRLTPGFLHPQLRILPVRSAENIRISPPHYTRCNIRTLTHPHIRILPQAVRESVI